VTTNCRRLAASVATDSSGVVAAPCSHSRRSGRSDLEMVLLPEVAVMADRPLREFPLCRAASVSTGHRGMRAAVSTPGRLLVQQGKLYNAQLSDASLHSFGLKHALDKPRQVIDADFAASTAGLGLKLPRVVFSPRFTSCPQLPAHDPWSLTSGIAPSQVTRRADGGLACPATSKCRTQLRPD
jgi:hypothetical protein